jgi:paraquat-inducible protein A
MTLHACSCCGLIQRAPPVPPSHRAVCARCRTRLDHASPRSLAWPAALALSALVLYPLAMALPVLSITRMGHASESTIWSGVVRMYADGHAVIATIVLLCSIVIPLGKIAGIISLCLPVLRSRISQRRRAVVYRLIDWLGRWGMIDVLLVAILIAAVKIGDWVAVTPGPGIIAFAGVVVLSLLSSVTFDPRSIWREEADPISGNGGGP